MKKKEMIINILTILLICIAAPLVPAAEAGRVLYIDSYHEGYAWSDGITQGIEKVLGDKVEFKIHRMDTKRNASDEFKKEAAEKAKKIIEEWTPNVVIASDDNASKFIIKPYYADKDLPFVFCGVNWDASVYGFPTKNVCGMEEVALINPLLIQMKKFARGDRLGFLTVDNITGHKEAENINKKFNLKMTEKYATSFEEWKNAFIELQKESDMIILENVAGLKNWDEKAAIEFMKAQTNVPTGCILDFMAPLCLVGYTKLADEQGEWAASTALAILNGTSPESIGITQNKKGQLFVNLPIAKKLGVTIPLKTLKVAKVIK